MAIPTWCGRVSPVLDTAGRLLVVRTTAGQDPDRQEAALTTTDLPGRVTQIADLNVSVLICGAVSQALEGMLIRRGMKVLSHVCGDVEEVLACYLAGGAPQDRFGMPGCCRRRRHGAGHRGGRCQGRRIDPP